MQRNTLQSTHGGGAKSSVETRACDTSTANGNGVSFVSGSPITTFGSDTLELTRTQLDDFAPENERQEDDNEWSQSKFDARSSLLQQQIATPVLHTHSLYRVGSSFFKQQHELAMGPAIGGTLAKPTSTKRLVPLASVSQSTSSLPERSPDHSKHSDKSSTRFYSIERLAENSFHAVKSKRKTWCFLPGVDERARSNRANGSKSHHRGSSSPRHSRSYASMSSLERPSKRSDVVDLDNAFEHAMEFVRKKSNFQEALPTEQNAMIDREWMACQQRVDQHFALAATRSCGDPQRLETIQNQLVKCLMQQKWADVVLGELESMLMGSFLEQGVLLGKVREQYAVAFDDLEQLLKRNVDELNAAASEISEKRDEVTAHAVRLEQLRAEMQQATESELTLQRSEFEKEREELERKAQDAKEQVAKMTETMKTLNTIFRQMREDSDKVRAVELKENYAKLEKRMEAHKEELEKLRPLVVANQRLEEQKRQVCDENELLKEKIKYSQELLESKDQLLNELMKQQSELLANEELRRQKPPPGEASNPNGFSNDGEADGTEPGQAGLTLDGSGAEPNNPLASQMQQALAQLAARKDSSLLCMRCRQSLSGNNTVSQGYSSASADNDNADPQRQQQQLAVSTPGVPRVQCVFFRILLPNLNGKRPQRSVSWTLSVVRSILFAKQLDDAVLGRKSFDVSIASGLRFPEFVYAWFEPWRSLRETKAACYEPGNVALIENAAANPSGISKTDEARWSLYYGVKAIISQLNLVEVKIFLALLDEKLSEDEVTFLFHCYRTLDALMGGKMPWGPLHHCLSFESFTKEFECLQAKEKAARAAAAAVAAATGAKPSSPVKPAPSKLSIDPRDTIPKVIWISTYHAGLATGVVLAKATAEERVRLEKQIDDVARKDLPLHEWPLYYLEEPRLAALQGGTRRSSSVVEPMVVSSMDLATIQSKDPQQKQESRQPKQQSFIDASLWIEYMLHEYKEEQAHRKAAIRLMFQTAASSSTEVNSSSSQAQDASTGPNSSSVVPASMDLDQFRAMVRTLNDEISCASIATMYRNAYIRGNGAVGFESFMEVAEAAHFFSSCLRLENPVSSMAKMFGNGFSTGTVSGAGTDINGTASSEKDASHPNKHDANSQLAIATLVHRGFVLLQKELVALMENLPLSMRTTSDILSFEVSSRLEEGDGIFFGDGLRLMTGFHVLLQELLHYKLIKAELASGSHLNSRAIFMLEKALNGLWDCVRVQEKSPIEVLITTVKQKLCVSRVQLAFRGHLHRDEGAPLAIRHLLHRDYGSGRTKYRNRRAFRSIKWLLCVISDCLRFCCYSPRAQLLGQLGSIGSDFMSSNSLAVNPDVVGDSDCSSSSKKNTMNVKIGTSVKPLVMEMLYDYFLERFGTRWEAEKLIHDLFVNCRVHLNGHQRVMLFASLCSMAAASDDRLLGQNEALAFLNAILKSGLHPFRAVRSTHSVGAPSSIASSSFRESQSSLLLSPEGSPASTSPTDEEGDDIADMDVMPMATAERILFMAFDRLKVDQKQRLRMRMEENLLFVNSTTSAAASRRYASAQLTANTSNRSISGDCIDADAFLNFALNEWKRYVLYRMNEVRMACCLVHDQEDSSPLFEQLLSVDTVLLILQRAQVQCSSTDAALVFRRVCASQDPGHATAIGNNESDHPTRSHSHSGVDQDNFADRLAAAAYPLITRETLEHLNLLDEAPTSSLSLPTPLSPTSVAIVPMYPPESFQLLISCWEPYESTCHTLYEQLKKHLDVARLTSTTSTSGSSSSTSFSVGSPAASSSSSSKLTRDELQEIETLMMKFYDQRRELHEIFTKVIGGPDAASDPGGKSSTSVLMAARMAPATVGLLNDSWKSFRRLLVAFVKARGAARLGIGPIPDQWDINGQLGFS